MVSWPFLFCSLTVVAGLVGFSDAAPTTVLIAKVFFVLFFVMLLVSLVRQGPTEENSNRTL